MAQKNNNPMIASIVVIEQEISEMKISDFVNSGKDKITGKIKKIVDEVDGEMNNIPESLRPGNKKYESFLEIYNSLNEWIDEIDCIEIPEEPDVEEPTEPEVEENEDNSEEWDNYRSELHDYESVWDDYYSNLTEAHEQFLSTELNI